MIFPLIIALISFSFCKMHPVIMRYAVSTAQTLMLNSANEAVTEILEENNISYADLVHLSTDTDGYVTSLETNIYGINRLKSSISGKISEIIDSREYYGVKIPLGTFFGNTYTAGWGPALGFKLQLTSTAAVNFSHEFKAAGINQVLHIIMIEIDISGSLVIAGFNESITASTSAIAAQTVIVGKTPEAFTNVIENEGDATGGLINDYGAVAD